MELTDIMNNTRIYLDVCVICRPFDNQDQMRIRLETSAYYLILRAIEEKRISMVVSPVHYEEVSAISDSQERSEIIKMLKDYGEKVNCDLTKARARAEHLETKGFGIADAAHAAFAEFSSQFFISCDDNLLKKCKLHDLEVVALNPVEFTIREDLR